MNKKFTYHIVFLAQSFNNDYFWDKIHTAVKEFGGNIVSDLSKGMWCE